MTNEFPGKYGRNTPNERYGQAGSTKDIIRRVVYPELLK
jgi:hypothetical protein